MKNKGLNSRKKICHKCGRNLWIKNDFYAGSSYCKECCREIKKIAYHERHKVEDGVFYSSQYGRIVEHNGMSTKIYWSQPMLDKITRYYHNTKNDKLAEHLGVSSRTLTRKARELGLTKDEDFMTEVSTEGLKLAHFLNKIKGNPGMIKKGEHRSPSTEFKSKSA